MSATMPSPLILASGSPRRRAFLRDLGLDFTVQSADIDETPLPNEMPTPLALRLAQSKARAVADLLRAEEKAGLVIAADTVVALDDHLLGKPLDAAEARAMLAALRGRTHQVVTGLCLLDVESGREETRSALSEVAMRVYSNEEMEAYIASGDPFDKAGGYAIQNSVFAPVAGYTGSFTSIMGLPLEELAVALADFGVEVNAQRFAHLLERAANPAAWRKAIDSD